jgi:hypothetical protein
MLGQADWIQREPRHGRVRACSVELISVQMCKFSQAVPSAFPQLEEVFCLVNDSIGQSLNGDGLKWDRNSALPMFECLTLHRTPSIPASGLHFAPLKLQPFISGPASPTGVPAEVRGLGRGMTFCGKGFSASTAVSTPFVSHSHDRPSWIFPNCLSCLRG